MHAGKGDMEEIDWKAKMSKNMGGYWVLNGRKLKEDIALEENIHLLIKNQLPF